MELLKQAIAAKRVNGTKTRAGRRPMRVSTLLKKEKEGSLYKTARDAFGVEVKGKKARLLGPEESEQRFKATKRNVKDLMKNINEYLLTSTPKVAAAYWTNAEREKNANERLPGMLSYNITSKKPSWWVDEYAEANPGVTRNKAREQGYRQHVTDAYRDLINSVEERTNQEVPISGPYPDDIRTKDMFTGAGLGALGGAAVGGALSGGVGGAALGGLAGLALGGSAGAGVGAYRGSKAQKALEAKRNERRSAYSRIHDEEFAHDPIGYAALLERDGRISVNELPSEWKQASVGKAEAYVPWYGTAMGGAGGAMLGNKLLPKKYKTLGTLGGTLLGTAVGLHGGEALGRAVDKRMAKKASEALVEDEEDTKYQVEDSADPVQHSIASILYTENRKPTEKELSSRKKGEVPTVSTEESENADSYNGWNPGSTLSNAKTAGADLDLIKVAYLNLIDLQMEKVANDPNLTEMEKEALLRYLGAAGKKLQGLGQSAATKAKNAKDIITGAPVKLDIGDEVVQVASNKVLPSMPTYKGVGKELETIGGFLKTPKGMSPEQAKRYGFQTSVGSRIAGEAAESAGHHMGHASTATKILNAPGPAVGGAFEGTARGIGKELQRAGGAIQTGVSGASTLGGGIRGSIGRGLEKAAPTIGQVGEIGTAAGMATGLGHAVTPAAGLVSKGLQHVGLYAPLKGSLGSLGLNTVKDITATGLEKAINAGTKVAPRAAHAIRAGAPIAGRVARGAVKAVA